MVRRLITSAFVVSMLAGSAAGAAAQTANAAGPVTISGTVTAVIGMSDGEGNVGVHLRVRTDSGLVGVRLGPAMFIGMSNFSFSVDDVVEVVATRTADAEPTYVARSIKGGERTLTLRDETGAPVWDGTNGIDGCGVSHAAAHAGS